MNFTKQATFSLLIILILGACSKQNSYQMVSEMNTLYPIEIIYVDEATQKKLGEFPFERSHHAKLIENIQKDTPAAIVLKFFFDTETEHDQALATTLKKYNNVFTQASVYSATDAKISPKELERYSIPVNNVELADNDKILLPNNTLLNEFAGLGTVGVRLTTDNEIIGGFSIEKTKGVFIPNLSLSLVKELSRKEVSIDSTTLRIGNKAIELGEDQLLPLDLSKPNTLYPIHSYLDVLENDTANFENKIVIIYIEDPAVRYIKSKYNEAHNNAELVADNINTLLKLVQ